MSGLNWIIVVLGLLALLAVLFSSPNPPSERSCETHRNTPSWQVPARCLDYFGGQR